MKWNIALMVKKKIKSFFWSGKSYTFAELISTNKKL